MSAICSKVRIPSLGSHRTPSSGMQYTQRKLQRSVTLIRNTFTAPIDLGPVSNDAGRGANGSSTFRRIAAIVAPVTGEGYRIDRRRKCPRNSRAGGYKPDAAL